MRFSIIFHVYNSTHLSIIANAAEPAKEKCDHQKSVFRMHELLSGGFSRLVLYKDTLYPPLSEYATLSELSY